MNLVSSFLIQFTIILQCSNALGISGILPVIEDVVKNSEGYSNSITLKFTYSPILTALYNKIDIFKCKLGKSKDLPNNVQLVRTIDAIVEPNYEIEVNDMPAGKACLQVCGRSSYRNAKKCSKIYSFYNKIQTKHSFSASENKIVDIKGGNSHPSQSTIPYSLTGHIIGYDLILMWRNKKQHTTPHRFSLRVKLLADLNRSIKFGNGENELVLESATRDATNHIIVRLPYSHFKFDFIQVTLCCLFLSPEDGDYTEKLCPLPLFIPNNIVEYNVKSGVVDIKVDNGEAHVRLSKSISVDAEDVSIECAWFDTRIEISNRNSVLRQNVRKWNQNVWEITIKKLEFHAAYSCFIHIITGNSYSLYSDTPFVFHTFNF